MPAPLTDGMLEQAGVQKRDRLYSVDLLRFCAALMVVFFHYAFRGYAADNMTTLPYPFLATPAKYGYLGVCLFFIISGFVIHMTAANGSSRKFVISRVVRLYPAFWTCCTITFLLTVCLGLGRFSVTVKQYLVNMTMLNGFVGVESVDGAYWSLFVELKFYALVFAVLAFNLIDHAEQLLSLWLIVLLVLLKWHVPHLSFFLFPEHAPLFIAGGVFYLVYASGMTVFRGVLLSVSFLLAILQTVGAADGLTKYYATRFVPGVIGAVVALYYLVFLLISLRRLQWLSTPRWLTLGAMTYPLYLLHQNIGFMIFNVAYPALNGHLVFWTTFALVLFLALLVNKYVEAKSAPHLKRLLSSLLRVQGSRRADVST